MHFFLLISGLTAIGLGWNLPNHYPLWTTFHAELVSALGLCLLFVGVLWRSLTPPHRAASPSVATRLPLPLAARVWLGLALIPLLQYATGGLVFRGDAALGFLYAAGIAFGLYTGYLWAQQAGIKTVVTALYTTIVFAALAAGGLALVQWMRIPAPSWWAMELIGDRPFGNFGQPNQFALLMVMGVVGATMLFELRAVESRASHALALFFFGWCLLVSESRANAFGMLAVTAVWFATRHRVPSRLRLLDVLLALTIGYAVYRSLGFIEEALYLKAVEARAPLEVGPRQLIWLHFWAAILEHPWAGYGFGQGVMALREVAASVQPSRNTIYAHNLVLDLMTWFGIPLGVLLSGALGVWMLRWLRRDPDTELSVQRHGVFALWLALLVHSLLEFPHAHAFFLIPAALLAGAVTVGAGLPIKAGKVAASRPALALAAFTALLLAATTVDYFQFETEFRQNRFEKANFLGQEAREAPAEPWVLDQLALLNASAHYVIRAGMPPDQIDNLGRLARRFHLLPTRFSYAKALALNGRMPEAEHELLTIRSIYLPAAYAAIDRDWQAWLKQNQSTIESGR
jgi:hypothetical protein